MANPIQPFKISTSGKTAGFGLSANEQTNAHALGSYRNDLSYTAALKSDTLAKGSYRQDIAYTAALKAGENSSKNNQASSSLKFAGANTSWVAPVLFFSPLISTFSKLDQKNSMFAVAARDAFDSSGRAYQEYKRNPHGGRESLIEEFIATAVWGFGIPAMKKLYDSTVSRLSQRQGAINVQFPDLDMTLLPKSNGLKSDKAFDRFIKKVFQIDNRPLHEQLTPDIVEKYFKNVNNLPEHIYQNQKQQLLDLLKDGAVGQKVINKYRGNQFMKLLLCTLVPVLGIAVLVPRGNQWFTRKKINEEKAAQQQQQALIEDYTHSQQHQHLPGGKKSFHQSDILRMAATPAHKTPVNAANGNVQFSGALGQRVSDVMGGFLASDTATSVAFVDTPLSTGRVVTARNKDERIERAFREICIIVTLFFIQKQLQTGIQNKMDKWLGTHCSVEFKALEQLYKQAKAQGPKAEEQFLADYNALRQMLGNPGKLADHTTDSAKMIESIRDYFSKPITQRNMLYDLAEASGKIPTIQVKNNPAMPKYINITRQIDDDGVKVVARYLDALAEKIGSKQTTVQKALTKTTGSKMAAFGVASGICWTLVSLLVPKAMHGITKLRTGKDEFPGIEGLA